MVEYNECREDKALKELRPELYIIDEGSKTEIETFQNETLRPILKLQHNLLMDFIQAQPNFDAVQKYKDKRVVFFERIRIYLQQPLLKGILLGMILGYLTSDELQIFNQNSKEYKKRIHQMFIQRFSESL